MTNVALIGYGYWGPNIARNIAASPLTNLYAICDKRQENLDKARQTYAESTIYTANYKELIRDKKLDAFAVAVPVSENFHIAKEILQSGKHVFLEKPLTASSAQAKILLEMAKEKNGIIHVDHLMVFHPIVKRMKQMLDSGELGELIYFDSSRMNLGPIKYDVSAMWDLAVHDIAVIDYLGDGKQPLMVEAMGEKRYGDKETLTYLTLQYECFVAHLKSSWISPLKERRMIVAGTKKMVVFDDMRVGEKMLIYDRGIDMNSKKNKEYGAYEYEIRTGDILIPYISDEDALKNSIEHFVGCIQKRTQSISGPEQGLRVIKVLERAEKRLRENACM